MIPEHNKKQPGKANGGMLSHAFWMGFLGGAFYLALVLFTPLFAVITIAVYMGFGKHAMEKALRERQSSMPEIAGNFSQCLKLFAMQLVWPLSIGIISGAAPSRTEDR